MPRFSRRAFVLLLLPLALHAASCLTRSSTGAASHLRAKTPLVASYGDAFEVYYHWGEATFLDRLTNNHIPNHIYPGEESAYGYYSDNLHVEVMQHSALNNNPSGPGLYVAADPISSITFGFGAEKPTLIEVIIDKRVAAADTLLQLDWSMAVGKIPSKWFVFKKNKGVYFRKFSGAGFSEAALLDFKKNVEEHWARMAGGPFTRAIPYFNDSVDAIIKNPPNDKVRLLPPRDWVCPLE